MHPYEGRGRYSRSEGFAAALIAALVAVTALAPTLLAERALPTEPIIPSAAEVGEVAMSQLGEGFTENAGQINNRDVRFYASAGGIHAGFAQSGVLFHLTSPETSESAASLVQRHAAPATDFQASVSIRLTFEGSNVVLPRGIDELPYRNHYFLGENPSGWRTDVRSYGHVIYEELYDGIDLVYRRSPEGVKYEFLVAPRIDIAVIQMRFEGVEGLELDGSEVVLRTALGELRDSSPVAYEDGGIVPCSFLIRGGPSLGFRCEGRDDSRALILDPLLYATYLGGIDYEYVVGMAVDALGNMFVTGSTYGVDFPVTVGAVQTSTGGGPTDAFVAKLNPTGDALLYSTYIGGESEDEAYSIAVDSSGNAYIAGHTGSSGFPATAGAFQTSLRGGTDAFAVMVNSSGSALVYATYFGGGAVDGATDIAVDSSGNAFITGYTDSTNLPTTVGAFQPSNTGLQDAFVAKLDPTGSAAVYATYLGGTWYDVPRALAIDASWSASVAGQTDSTDFPTTPGAFQPGWGGTGDAFVARLNPAGSDLVYATYLGGDGWNEVASGVAVNASGYAVVTGETDSTDFPATPGALQTSLLGSSDAFVAVLDPAGSALTYATYLGGDGRDVAAAVIVDPATNVYVSGDTDSTDFPTTIEAVQNASGGGLDDAFIAALNITGNILLYATYMGGNSSDGATAIAIDPAGDLYVSGFTDSVDFPATSGAYDTTFNGAGDGFIAKVSIIPGPVPPTVSVSSPPDGTWVSTTTVPLAGIAVDGGGTGLDRVEVSCDNGASWVNATLDPATGDWSHVCPGLVEGPNLIHARAFDNASVESSHAVLGVNVDLTPPTVSIVWPVDGAWIAAPSTTSSGTAADGGSGLDRVEVSCNGGSNWNNATGTTSWTFPCTGLLAGPNAVHARSFDRVGWGSVPMVLTVNVDWVTPVVSITSPTNGAISNQDVTLTYTIVDDLDPAPTVSGPASGTVYGTEGPWTVTVQATDAAGNVGTSTVTFTIDKTPPTIAITGPTNLTVTNLDVTLTYMVTDAMDLTPAVTGPLNGTVFSNEGPQTVTVTATDSAGNTAAASVTFTIDKTPPTITITGPANNLVTNLDVPLTYSVADALDPAPTVTGPASGTDFTAEGSQTITITATDSAGNSATASVTFTIDKTAPAISIASPANSALTNGNVTLTYTVTDALDATPSVTGPASGTVYTTDGPQTITLTASDAAGNSATASVTFTIDRTPPAVTLTCPPELQFAETASCTVTATDTQGTPTVSWLVTREGATVAQGNGTAVTFTASAAGTYTITVTTTDAAGNVRTESRTVTAKAAADLLLPILLVVVAAVAGLLLFFWRRRKKPDEPQDVEPPLPPPAA